jgi:hypothetical protein
LRTEFEECIVPIEKSAECFDNELVVEAIRKAGNSNTTDDPGSYDMQWERAAVYCVTG